jgi:hypothetical protein
MRATSRLLLLGATAALAACAGIAGPPPKRPPVEVADQVQRVDRGAVIGTWNCRELNPYAEVPAQVSTVTYAADGGFVAKARYDAGAAPPFGGMSVVTTGKWSVENDRILTSDVNTQASSEDPFTNVLAGVASTFANSMSAQQQGSGDVLKLTRTELTLRPDGVEDPPVIGCTR